MSRPVPKQAKLCASPGSVAQSCVSRTLLSGSKKPSSKDECSVSVFVHCLVCAHRDGCLTTQRRVIASEQVATTHDGYVHGGDTAASAEHRCSIYC